MVICHFRLAGVNNRLSFTVVMMDERKESNMDLKDKVVVIIEYLKQEERVWDIL